MTTEERYVVRKWGLTEKGERYLDEMRMSPMDDMLKKDLDLALFLEQHGPMHGKLLVMGAGEDTFHKFVSRGYIESE